MYKPESIQEARIKARYVSRETWLRQHGRTEIDILEDHVGEYVCAETTWLNHFTLVEVKMYLPDNLQLKNIAKV